MVARGTGRLRGAAGGVALLRAALLGVALPLLIGCAAGPPGPTVLEHYVEVLPGDPELSEAGQRRQASLGLGAHLQPFPLLSDERERSWVASRGLDAEQGDPRLRAHGGEAQLLVLPLGEPLQAPVTLCYVGHTAFERQAWDRDLIAHQVRLLLVNRERTPLRLPAEGVELSGASGGGLRLLAVGDSRGRRAEGVTVAPGEVGWLQLFFASPRPDATLRVRWAVEAVVDPDAPSAAPARWELEVALGRGFISPEGQLTPVQLRVARGQPLDPPLGDPTREPLLDPVAPAGGEAGEGGEAGGGEAR